MFERMGFIVKSPVRFNHRSIASAGRVAPALLADLDTYREWWDAELTFDDAAMLLGGIKPHEREDHDDDSWVAGFERLSATLRAAAAQGEISEHPSLAQLVGWHDASGANCHLNWRHASRNAPHSL